jgi:sigma-B regulation protein RsbU (phosphoserine phosphatase)
VRAAVPARVKASGMGVAVKFSLATSLVVAGAMAVFTPVLYRTIAGVLSDEIDEAGIQVVRAMAVVDVGCWKSFHETALEGREEEFAGVAPTFSADQREEMEQFKLRRAANRERAQRIAEGAGTKILDAVILDAREKKVINGRGAIAFEPSGVARKKGGVTIVEGTYDVQGRRTRARLYAMPILDEHGEVAGHAKLALSEEKIGQTLGRLLGLMSAVAVVFVVLGLVVSWFVAQRITRPIAELSRDIDVVARGDLDHDTQPHSSDEIGAVARAFQRMTLSLREARELEQRQAAQAHEMGVARQVQEALFPAELPELEGYECETFIESAGQIGGDYYDVIPLPDGSFLFVLASASGAGVPAALVVTMARSLITSIAEVESSPAAALRRVNRLLAPDLRRGMCVTVLLARLEPASGRVTVANAGHAPLIWIHGEGGSAETVQTDGIALGFDKGPIFDRKIEDRGLDLAPGDRVVMCTRSLFEVRNAEGREIGEGPLLRFMARESAKHSEVFVPMVTHALRRHQGDRPPEQDQALITFKRCP